MMNTDANLNKFFADMTDENMLDALDHADEIAREWSPVPAEFLNMSIAEVEAEIQDMWDATR